jgi:hypothetical protein
MRPSSVVPGAAVNPNRALVSTTMPVEVAAFFFAFSLHPRLPAVADLACEPGREVRARFLDLVLDVAFDRALGDAQEVGNGSGALELLDQEPHLRTGRFRNGAGGCARCGPVETVSGDAHQVVLLPAVFGVALDVPGRVVSFVEHRDGPEQVLAALVLDHPR